MAGEKPLAGAQRIVRRFRLFINGRKEEERQPDYTGVLQLDGQEYRLAGWWKTTQHGDNYISGTVEPMGEVEG